MHCLDSQLSNLLLLKTSCVCGRMATIWLKTPTRPFVCWTPLQPILNITTVKYIVLGFETACDIQTCLCSVVVDYRWLFLKPISVRSAGACQAELVFFGCIADASSSARPPLRFERHRSVARHLFIWHFCSFRPCSSSSSITVRSVSCFNFELICYFCPLWISTFNSLSIATRLL